MRFRAIENMGGMIKLTLEFLIWAKTNAMLDLAKKG